jgi:[ribosomal protein S5]-alanine N-acetyltransferase
MKEINFLPFPDLTTGEFSLRQLTTDDRDEIFILRSDERVLEYLDIPKAGSLNDAVVYINMINNGVKNNDWVYWGITGKNESKLIGTICLWNILPAESKADIGFVLLPDQQGKGIMQEVIPVVLSYGFITMGLDVIKGEVAPGNIKSIKLMERFGFKYAFNLENTVIYTLQKPE